MRILASIIMHINSQILMGFFFIGRHIRSSRKIGNPGWFYIYHHGNIFFSHNTQYRFRNFLCDCAFCIVRNNNPINSIGILYNRIDNLLLNSKAYFKHFLMINTKQLLASNNISPLHNGRHSAIYNKFRVIPLFLRSCF